MAVERIPDPITFMFRIKMQHDSCDFAPVRTFRMRVEQAQIRHEMLVIVRGQHGAGGRISAISGLSGASAWASRKVVD